MLFLPLASSCCVSLCTCFVLPVLADSITVGDDNKAHSSLQAMGSFF